MKAATPADTDRLASMEASTLPDTDSLLSELGVLYPVMTFTADVGDASPPAGAREAPSDPAAAEAVDGRRTEMDERIMAGLLWG
jgi:hypothetical protein